MTTTKGDQPAQQRLSIPWFGARKLARQLLTDVHELQGQRDAARNHLEKIGAMATELVAEVKGLRAQREITLKQLETLGALSVAQLEYRRVQLETEIAAQATRLAQERSAAADALSVVRKQLKEARGLIVETDDLALLQEVGVYKYRHPLTDAVAYEKELAKIEDAIKAMIKKDGRAVLATTNWSVNGSATDGRAMVRDFSKLMLRAFNAEADNLVRGLKPFKLDAALDRLKKVSETIERLGKTMDIRIAVSYFKLRVYELQLTSDFLQKQAEEKEVERLARERLREERKVQQEIQRERDRLEKERQHYANALEAVVAKGDEAAAARLREQLGEVDRNMQKVDYRAANIRAGYVYLVSNIGSFGGEDGQGRHDPALGTYGQNP